MDKNYPLLQQRKMYLSLNNVADLFFLKSKKNRFQLSNYLTIALIAFLYLGFNDIHAQTISLKTSKELYVDKDWDNSPPGNLGPHATYIAYEFCNNTGSVTANLTATVTVSGTGYSLAGGQAATQTIGNLGVGKCVTLYWFVGYPHLINQNATVSVSLVENGSSIIGTVSDVITTKEASPDSKAGLLNTKTLSSDNGIGQVTNFDVEYVFGDVKEEEKITFQPAGNIDFEAGCFQLIGTEILTSVYACIPVGSKNRLNYTITEDCDRSGSNNKIKVRYYFLNKCIGATSAIQPYSGRHKEDGKYEYSKNFDTNQDANGNPLPTIVFAETQNHFTVTKTALPANITSLPAQVTYTVSITNNSETSANIDGIDDLLSLPLSFNAIHGSSEINTGNATSLPTLGATGHLRFIGGSSATSYPFKEFAFEPNQTINLVYTVNLAKNTPNAVYSNITKIFVGEYESEGVNVDITVSDGEPVAVNDTCGTNEDTATTTTNVLLNDTVIDYATITNYTTTSTKGGTVLYNNDGTFKYTPLANFNGTDTFTYTLCDDDSTPNCSTATVTITVSPVNDLPISVNDTAANILEDSGLINIKVLVNDSFGGDGPSTGSIIVTPIASTIGTAVLQNNDTPNNPTDDSIDFTPALNYHGPVSINYTIYDLDGDASSATVTFNVTSVNDLPVAKADIESMFENTTLNKNVFGNDTLSGDGGNIFALVSGVSNGTLTFNNDGTYSYSPNLNYNGNDSFQYKITDVDGDTSTTTVSITITDSGNPIAKPDTYNTPEDTNFITGNVLSNDEVLDGATITNFDATTTKGGTVSYNGNGTFNYAPALNFYGTDTFTYSLCDKDVPTPSCSTATVTINVASVNDAPTAVNDSKTGNEDTIITLNVTTNDSDLDGSINVATVDLNTSLAGIQNTITISGKGTFTVNPSGLVTFTPVANYYGVVTTNYNVQDNNGATSNNATITITVTSVNDVPVAANDTNSTNEDTSKTGNVATNDTPSGDGGNVWSLVGSNGGASNGTVTMTTAGNYTYTPNLSFSGIDSFTYQIKDVDGDITTATVTMTVIDRGNPVAVNDLVEVTENKTITTQNVLTNDSMIDGATFSSFEYTGGNGATISYNNNGTFTYTPSSNFYGIDTFTYTICDNDPTPSCSTTTVLVTVLIDSDDDGLADIHDFDDDNDGILDTVESAIDCDFYPTLSFVNPVLISGTTRQVGAVYRFSNVTVSGNTNLDCFVTIASSTGTGNVVDNFDVTSTDPVVNARFQPILRANVAQVNFNFKFVVSGTTTPFNIPQFYATGIDIDGNETQEYDIVGSNNYAVDSPTNIIITSTTSSTKFKGPSASYVSGANGIDDSVTIVMATVKYQERSEMNLNIGSSPTATNARQFAISFDPCFYFIYKNSTKVSEDLFYSDLDTDGDGIPNRLDLDSDNDGCSDALEAGSTTDTTVNYKFPTSPVGTDGVPDAVQVNNGSNSRLVDYTVIKTIPTGKFDFLDASVNVGCKADLSVTKTVNNTSPEIGDTVLFSIVLHNAGPYSTDGIKVKDILPTSLTYNSSNSVIPAGTTFDNATGIWDLSGYTMEVNSSIELKIAATVLSTCSLVTNTAEIITSEKTDPDSTPNNNVSTEDDYSEASLTVVDTTPPAFNSPLPADVTVECSAIPVAPTLTATDNCGSATVNLNTTSTKTNNGSCNDSSYTITRTWTATDCCGINTITHTQTITVQDTTAPIISAAPADASYQCLAEVPAAGNLTATDNCTSEFSVAGVDNINNDNPNETIITRTWTASDLCNNTSSVSQKITIRDTINPTIVCPDNITVNVDGDACGTDASNVILGTPIYNDNCSVATIDNDAPSSFPIGNTTVTWTVRDAAGNTATCEQTVTVVDNIKPVITECPATVSVTVDADACEVLASNVTLGTPTFTDNCPNTTITNDAPTSFPIGDTTVTWTVTDAAGNEATCIQTVTVTDNIKPVITECPATVSVSVDADACEVLASNVTLGTPTFTDNCPNTTITNDAPTSFPIGDTTVTWTVTDAAGNTATCEQTVTVVDNIKPIITECPATVSIPVDADACEVLASNVTLGTPTFTDNCPNTTITNDAPTS
ncbi:tandem-95 repeat protein, partial [Mariniflexile sp.]|uniref:tandem-95 repeat protein n=1 Tax=Mariniflexile sp. TaxID=1979402 RepID=UPI003564FDA1